MKFNTIKVLLLILCTLVLNNCNSTLKIETKYLIGEWYLEYEKDGMLIFDRNSNLFGSIEEIKNNGPEKSINFFSKDELYFSYMEFSEETFEIFGGSSTYNWDYNQKKRILVSEISKEFGCSKLKLIELTEDKMILSKEN